MLYWCFYLFFQFSFKNSRWSQTQTSSKAKLSEFMMESSDSNGPSRTSRDFWATPSRSDLPVSKSRPQLSRQKFDRSIWRWRFRPRHSRCPALSSWSTNRAKIFRRKSLWKVIPLGKGSQVIAPTSKRRWRTAASFRCRTRGKKSWPSVCRQYIFRINPRPTSRVSWPSRSRSLSASLKPELFPSKAKKFAFCERYESHYRLNVTN